MRLVAHPFSACRAPGGRLIDNMTQTIERGNMAGALVTFQQVECRLGAVVMIRDMRGRGQHPRSGALHGLWSAVPEFAAKSAPLEDDCDSSLDHHPLERGQENRVIHGDDPPSGTAHQERSFEPGELLRIAIVQGIRVEDEELDQSASQRS